MQLPPYGLSGGGLRFDPGTLLVFSETASTSWRIFSHRPDETALSQQEFVESARYMHERDHLLRTLTTSWGLVRHLLMSLLFSDCLHFLDSADSDLFRETAQLQPGRPGRVWKQARRAGGKIEELNDLSTRWPVGERTQLRYLSRLAFLQALDGSPVMPNPHLIHWGIGTTEMALLGAFGPANMDFSSSYERLWAQEAIPEVHADVGGFFPSAADVLESFGFEVEKIYGDLVRQELRRSSDLESEPRYFFVNRLFWKRLQAGIGARSLPIEFAALADLALWVPLTLNGFKFYKTPHTWMDIEPGWRFVQGLIKLEERGARLHDLSQFSTFGECDRAVLDIQEWLCEELGWPTPQELCDLWVQQLDECLVSSTTQAVFLHLGPGHPRLEWATALLRSRRDCPYSFYLWPHKRIEELAAVAFPGGVFRDKDIVFTSAGFGDEAANTSFLEHEVLTSSRALMEGAAAHPHLLRHSYLRGLKKLEGLSGLFLDDASRAQALLREATAIVASRPPHAFPRQRRFLNDAA